LCPCTSARKDAEDAEDAEEAAAEAAEMEQEGGPIEHERIFTPEDFRRIKAIRTAKQFAGVLDKNGAKKAGGLALIPPFSDCLIIVYPPAITSFQGLSLVHSSAQAESSCGFALVHLGQIKSVCGVSLVHLSGQPECFVL